MFFKIIKLFFCFLVLVIILLFVSKGLLFKPDLAIKYSSTTGAFIFSKTSIYYLYYDNKLKINKEISEYQYNLIPKKNSFIFTECFFKQFPDQEVDLKCKEINLPNIKNNKKYIFDKLLSLRGDTYLLFSRKHSYKNFFTPSTIIYKYNNKNKQSKVIYKIYSRLNDATGEIREIKKVY